MFQALAASGTVESGADGAGLQRVANPRRAAANGSAGPGEFHSTVPGGTANVRLVLAYHSVSNGSAIRVGIGATPAEIVSFEPSSVTFAAGAHTADVIVRGIGQGSALLALSVSEGFAASNPLPVTLVVQ